MAEPDAISVRLSAILEAGETPTSKGRLQGRIEEGEEAAVESETDGKEDTVGDRHSAETVSVTIEEVEI